MSTPIGYRPGDAWLVAGPSVLVVLAGSAQEPALSLWPLVRDRAPAAEVVAALTAAQPVAWAVVSAEPAAARVLVRGELDVAVVAAGGDREIVHGRGLITWSERVFPGAVEVEVGEQDGRDDDALLPVPGGVVRAAFARWTLGAEQITPADPDPVEPEQPAVTSERGDPTTAGADSDAIGDVGTGGHPESGEDVGPSDEPGPSADPVPGADPGPIGDVGPSGDSGPSGDRDASELDPGDDEAGDDAVTVISMVPRNGSGVPNPRPIIRSAEPGAHRADVTQSVPLDEDLDAVREPGAAADEQAERQDAADEQAEPAADQVDTTTTPTSTPAGDRPVEPPGPAAPPAAPPAGGPSSGVVLGDHDGITMLAEDLPAGFIPPQLPPEPPPGWVYAAMCPSGHPNQPHAGNCRICGQPIPPVDPVATPRPLLGRVRLSTGVVADLDRRVVIGRAPTVSRVSSSELPRLITVPSPLHDVSRSHVEIRVDDWHLVIADLHSTNGTVVRAPDRPEQLLHPGQELVVEPGWTVDLGDGITFVIEAAT